MIYEYKNVKFSHRGDWHISHNDVVAGELNDLGAEGWKVIDITKNDLYSKITAALLMREVKRK